MPKLTVLECIVCGKTFDEADVAKLNYFPETRTCYDCYKRGMAQPHGVWCFGKYDMRSRRTGKIELFGYDPDAVECSKDCPDRRICPSFASGEIERMRANAQRKILRKDRDSKAPSRIPRKAC